MTDVATANDDLLLTLGHALIDAIETYYELPGIEADATLPDRRYVSDGVPAYDDAQLTVHFTRTFTLDSAGQLTTTFPLGPLVWRGVEAVVTLLRYSPVVDSEEIDTVTIPTVEEIERSAGRVLGDAERVADAVVHAYRDGLLLPDSCNGVFHVGWQSYGPEGGLAGGVSVLHLRLQ